jgi:formylglycine-generating enzyme
MRTLCRLFYGPSFSANRNRNPATEERGMFWKNRGIAVLAALAVVCSAVTAQAAITIETVPVGNTGSTADTAAHSGNPVGQGAVPYDYNIGKYEVTAGQYTAFLNAVAKTDTYALYNSEMANTSYGSGISQSGMPGSYSYSVDSAFVNRPVNYVSYWDACRFANWLNNDQKTTAQDPTVTEHGAYTLTADGISNNTTVRNTDWKWAVTSEDEWYKAAYHKNNGNTANFWDYPTKQNVPNSPGRDMTESSNPGNNANIQGNPSPIDGTHFTTVGGEFELSDSAYHTFDQGGNVWEWNDSILYSLSRGLRGGSFSDSSDNLVSTDRSGSNPADENFSFGFRVASVLEPGCIAMLLAAAGGLLIWRVRRK